MRSVRQVTGAVLWVESVQLLIQQQPSYFIEVGPGRVLSGLLRQIDRSQKSLNVEDSASLDKTLAALDAAGGNKRGIIAQSVTNRCEDLRKDIRNLLTWVRVFQVRRKP